MAVHNCKLVCITFLCKDVCEVESYMGIASAPRSGGPRAASISFAIAFSQSAITRVHMTIVHVHVAIKC